MSPKPEVSKPAVYQIRIGGRLSEQWQLWFEQMCFTQAPNGDTLLTGVVDQAALHGLLRKVRDLGLPLVSVTYLPAGPADEPGAAP